jgi:hypothetical protein
LLVKFLLLAVNAMLGVLLFIIISFLFVIGAELDSL